jgi:hypothetical protein
VSFAFVFADRNDSRGGDGVFGLNEINFQLSNKKIVSHCGPVRVCVSVLT